MLLFERGGPLRNLWSDVMDTGAFPSNQPENWIHGAGGFLALVGAIGVRLLEAAPTASWAATTIPAVVRVIAVLLPIVALSSAYHAVRAKYPNSLAAGTHRYTYSNRQRNFAKIIFVAAFYMAVQFFLTYGPNFVTSPKGFVAGYLCSGADAAPLAGARVTLHDHAGVHVATFDPTTDDTGYFLAPLSPWAARPQAFDVLAQGCSSDIRVDDYVRGVDMCVLPYGWTPGLRRGDRVWAPSC